MLCCVVLYCAVLCVHNIRLTSLTSSPSHYLPGIPPVTIGAVAVPFPAIAFSVNPFYGRVGPMLGLLMSMSTLYPLSRLVKAVVAEKVGGKNNAIFNTVIKWCIEVENTRIGLLLRFITADTPLNTI